MSRDFDSKEINTVIRSRLIRIDNLERLKLAVSTGSHAMACYSPADVIAFIQMQEDIKKEELNPVDLEGCILREQNRVRELLVSDVANVVGYRSYQHVSSQ